MHNSDTSSETLVRINAGPVTLEGNLTIPGGAEGVVLFAHGSGSSRHSPRNRYVAGVLNQARLATLLIDLLTSDEEEVDMRTAELRFNIPLLAGRLTAATDWLLENESTNFMKIGYFGASTGAAAALVASTERPKAVNAIVSRGGRPDMAGEALPLVQAPTLLIVGGDDTQVITLNEIAYDRLQSEKEMRIIPGATHLFSEPGTLEAASRLATEWFTRYLATPMA